MGLFGGPKNCVLCGNKMPLMGNAKMADATICASCKEKEFSPDMQVYEFYKQMPLAGLDQYRAYRTQNREKLKNFEPTDVFFSSIHLDRDTGEFVIFPAELPKGEGLLELNPDLYDLNQLIFYDQFYVNSTFKSGMLSDKIITDIAMVISTAHPYHPFALSGVVKSKVKMKVQTGFFGGIKSFDEDPELTQFVSYVTDHMPPAMADMMASFADETVTDIPSQLTGQYDAHFTKLTELKNMGVIDKEGFKNYPDSNIANKKLRSVVRKKYGLR